MSAVKERSLSSTELAHITGASVRQIDYWTRAGIIRPAVEAHGSGHYRQWDAEIVPLVRLLACISNGVVCGSGRNPELHRRVADRFEAGELDLGGGVRLVWSTETEAAS